MASHFVYTSSELRANLRAALQNAEAGATVVIDRYGEKFILKHISKESPYIPDFKQEYIDEASEIDPKKLETVKVPAGLVQSTPPTTAPMQEAVNTVANMKADYDRTVYRNQPQKNNSEGKPSKPKNFCSEHLVSKDVCKLMKHKA